MSVTSQQAPARTWLPWAGLLARLVVGGVFLVAGLLKVGNPHEAGASVQAYRLLPPVMARTIGYGLPTLEICLGVLLILGLFTRIAAVITGLLLVAFVIGIASVWARGYNIDCGCFGSGGDVTDAGRAARYSKEIARDVGMALLCVFLVWRPRTALSVDAWLTPQPVDLTDLDDLDDLDDDLDSDARKDD